MPTLTLQEERDLLLEILAAVPAGGLADALYACGYDTDITVPLLTGAGADLSLYRVPEPEPTMTVHDRLRRQRANKCNRNDPESLADAIRGLQSTDHPSLLPLHDELMARYQELTERKTP